MNRPWASCFSKKQIKSEIWDGGVLPRLAGIDEGRGHAAGQVICVKSSRPVEAGSKIVVPVDTRRYSVSYGPDLLGSVF
jgi:hypothetical protein